MSQVPYRLRYAAQLKTKVDRLFQFELNVSEYSCAKLHLHILTAGVYVQYSLLTIDFGN